MIMIKKMTILIVLTFAAGLVWGQADDKQILSGRDLLKTIRQQKGTSDKPSYEQRKQQEQTKPARDANAPADVNKTQTAKPPADANVPAEAMKIEIKKPADVNIPAAKKTIEEKLTEKPKVTAPTAADANKPPSVQKQMPRQTAGDKLFSVIPADSLFILRVNNLDYALSQADLLLGDLSPMASGLSAAARMAMAELFGSPDLKGINMAGSFALFGLPASNQVNEEASMPSLYVLMPMKDYGLFSNGNPNVGKPDENKISKITVDANETLAVKQMGNFALLAPESQYEGFKALQEPSAVSEKTSIASMIETDAMKNASSATIWLWVNTQKLAESFGEDLTGQLTSVSMMTGGMVPLQTTEAGPEQILKDLRSLSLAITPSAKMIKISGIISTVSGTETAKILAADSPFMQQIIEGLKAQNPKQLGTQLKEITTLIPAAKNADFVGTVNLMDLVKADANIPMVTADTAETEPAGNMVFALKCSDDKLTFDIAVPKEQLSAVAMAALPMIMMFGEQETAGAAMTFDMNSPGGLTFDINSVSMETTTILPKQTITFQEENGVIIAQPRKVDLPDMYGKSDNLFKMPLITMLPNKALGVTGGVLKKAAGGNSENILPGNEWDCQIEFFSLSDDKRTVEFDIALALPNESVKTLKEAQGSLDFLTSSGSEKKESGPIDFMPGIWIEALGTTIQSISNSPLKENDTDITLQLNVEPQTILSAQFFSQDGKPLEAQQTGWSKIDSIYTIKYTISGRIPPAGKIIFETAKNVQKNTIPFKAANLPLTIETR